MTHAIAFGEENVVEHGSGNIFKVVGAIVVGGAVEVGGADALHGIDVREIEIFAAAEHEVLEEVGEAGFTGLFVFGADVIPGVDSDDGSFVVLVNNDGEAIVEDKFGEGNVGDRNTGTFWSASGRFRFWSGGIGLRVSGKEKERREN